MEIQIFFTLLFILIIVYILISFHFPKIKYHFISFHSEGPPNDNATNFTKYRDFTYKKASDHFDSVTIYTPDILHKLGYGRYLKEYEATPFVSPFSPVEKIGLSGFRPAMILHELSKMKDDDILVFRDINYEKYPTYKHFDNITRIAEECLRRCQSDFFVPFHSPGQYNDTLLKNITKTKPIKELGENHPFSYEIPVVHAYLFILRKSPESIGILEEWKSACENEEWLDGESYGETNAPGFVFHTIDQSLLGLVIANRIRRGLLPTKYPGLYFNDRDIHKLREWTNWRHLQFKSLGEGQ
jgi:hypothetical protein